MCQPPNSLFRYRNLSTHSLRELINEEIWYSTPTSFNDPFDCALTLDQKKFSESVAHAIDLGINRGLIRRNLSDEMRTPRKRDQQMYAEVSQMIKKIMSEIGICCFSEDPRNILMWSHYADDHKGFCVEYSCSEGTRLSKEVSSVIYTQQRPSLSIEDIGPEKSAKTIEILWRTKASCWHYEKEWRALAPKGGKIYPAPAPILSVIFGQRMPEQDKDVIRQSLSGQPWIKFKTADLHNDKFKIEIT